MSKLKITVQRLSEIEMRINELEQYQCRSNLRLHGNSEEKQENIKAKDADICCAVVGENQTNITENIDITHHLCCLNDKQRGPRTTIISFPNKTSLDLVWRMSKTCSFLKENKLRFTEELTIDNKLREQLWPLIVAARKDRKRAHFAGVRIIIEGKEIRPSLSVTERKPLISKWTQQTLPKYGSSTLSIEKENNIYSERYLETFTINIFTLS
ncbi:hypothetical protein AMECASPLE_028082 [Ameca splendens]|uniref:Uncharacterized protein n=1 Tax=Ameca splendens TaxID=208324 RepID=A0ABV0XUA3_9TELE